MVRPREASSASWIDGVCGTSILGAPQAKLVHAPSNVRPTKALAALSPAALATIRTTLLGGRGEAFLRLLVHLNLGSALDSDEHAALDVARQTGLVAPGRIALTPLGWLAADPMREYFWWRERGGRLHSEGEHECLSLAYYAGKAVLEPGSGFGCNLLSMCRVPGRFVGVEPVTLYRQLTPVFAEREGLPTPSVVDGWGEALPFATGEFDVVVCFSAHQYMDVRIALVEMARVLRRGGQLQIVGGVLSLPAMARRWRRNLQLGTLKRDLLTIANTWAYERTGRRLHVPRGAGATRAPIYPSTTCMQRWLRAAGLCPRDDLSRPLGTEHCFIADKVPMC